MIDPKHIAEGVELLQNPPPDDLAAQRIAFARIVAGSHQLEGIDSSVESVLEAADVYAKNVHNAAS